VKDPPGTARGIAWRILLRVERDRAYADLALHEALRASKLERRDRALATEITYGALRLRGRLDHALEQVVDQGLARTDLGVRNLLRLGAYQILCLDNIRHAAAVDETVKLARAAGLARASGFVNAVLRQLARRADAGELTPPSLQDDPLGHLESHGSLPHWLAERWLEAHGPEAAIALALALCEPPPRTVRVSPAADLDAVTRRLGGRACRFAARGVTDIPVDPVRDRGFAAGEFSVQDEAAQLVVALLDPQPGETVVDCCAAPGGKAVQIAQAVGEKGEVVALELHQQRLALIRREARRLGLSNLRILQRDATRGFDLQGRLRFPRILVDAPCSGLGVLRRNPEVRWRIQPQDLTRCADTQLRILESVERYVEDDGVLVYSVCTLTPEETSGVTESFLQHHPEFRIGDPRPLLTEGARTLVQGDGTLRTLPHRDGCDGFFAVRLVRR
jgi:16S rRNA (cytosine967-C5)-methyltransferase